MAVASTTLNAGIFLGPDIHSNRPSTALGGTLYVCTTHSIIEKYVTGTGWTNWASLTSSGMTDPTTTKGDLIAHGSTTDRLSVGSNGQVLTADSTQTLGVKWATPASGFADPTTTKGDLIVHGSTTDRLTVGSNGQVLTADSTQTAGMKWATVSGGSASGAYDWNYYPYADRFNAATIETRVGTYSYTAGSAIGGGFVFNSSSAVNDTIDFSVWLGPGTYDLYVVGGTDTNRGITTYYIDDGAGSFTSVGTKDWYGSNANDIASSVTGIVLTGSVVRRKIRVKVTSKNASSSTYFMSLEQIRMIRTA